jgi:short-subunit dehydrogenase
MKDKVVIITGASSGIGLATAKLFASKGSKVVLASRNFDKLEEIENAINRSEGTAFSVRTDVSKLNDCKNLIEKTIEKFGKIDILINNAGVSMRALFVNTEISVIRSLMEINFFGTIYCSKFAMPYLIKSKGSLVGVSSVAGFHGLPGRAGYSASKFAMQGFLETIRIENLKNGLHVMIVAPGFTTSNIRKSAFLGDGSFQGESPLEEQKLMKPEHVANRIYYGVLKRRRTLILSVEGAFTILFQRILPHYLDRVFYKQMKKEPNSPLQ